MSVHSRDLAAGAVLKETATVEIPFPDFGRARIAAIGLGYVGLPLVVEFGKPRSDLCNSKVSGIIGELRYINAQVDVRDSWVSSESDAITYGVKGIFSRQQADGRL